MPWPADRVNPVEIDPNNPHEKQCDCCGNKVVEIARGTWVHIDPDEIEEYERVMREDRQADGLLEN
ncbi:hypothetical protein [Herbidospora sp. NBRC 101105]|uniref:hypothetical protein n=1 Tax=Herbidospora sp. NBRC 101105 TaxID=3032195 RepID=UPI0024A1EC99|nr:hypothetical protein [Herbidospora sp. NBRC 101105]GLX95882.1 hypothetical protein Hesp01_38320 [Herbidospora sp. NBRC 101105]